MSFSNDVKLELAHVVVEKACCQRSLLAGIVLGQGRLGEREGVPCCTLDITNAAGVRLVLRLARSFGNPRVVWEKLSAARFREESRYRIYLTSVPHLAFLEAIGISRTPEASAPPPRVAEDAADSKNVEGSEAVVRPEPLRRAGEIWRGYEYAEIRKRCCKRAFVRGAFLVGGSVGHPSRYYHLEWISRSRLFEDVLVTFLDDLELPVNALARKHHVAFYLKGANDIARALTVMGATQSLLYLEEVRAVKETKNIVHRRVNCETANLERTSEAAARQAADIRCIAEHLGLVSLPEELRRLARLRLKYPEASYTELGKRMSPGWTKVAVSRAMVRLEQLAGQLERGEKPKLPAPRRRRTKDPETSSPPSNPQDQDPPSSTQ